MSLHTMRRFILVSLFAFVVLPSVASAAFNDVSLTTDTVITVGGINLSVTGTTAMLASIVMDSSSFDVDLQSGSHLFITSTDRRTFTLSPSSGTFSDNAGCTVNESTLSLEGTGTVTVTITPTASTCTTTSAGGTFSGGSSGGSGGGGSSSSVTTTQTATEPQSPSSTTETTNAATTPQTGSTESAAPTAQVSPVQFLRALSIGSSGDDVKELQRFLNVNGFVIAGTGVGSPGNETNYFGRLTEVAVQKFQAKYGLVSSGSPETTGYGAIGPKTRAKLAELSGSVSTPETSSAAQPSTPTAGVAAVPGGFSRMLQLGSSGADVKKLQQLLNADPDTNVAESGIGSSGRETEYFGKATERAVQKFQTKYGIVSSGTPETTGYGSTGPKTRIKLNEVSSQ